MPLGILYCGTSLSRAVGWTECCSAGWVGLLTTQCLRLWRLTWCDTGEVRVSSLLTTSDYSQVEGFWIVTELTRVVGMEVASPNRGVTRLWIMEDRRWRQNNRLSVVSNDLVWLRVRENTVAKCKANTVLVVSPNHVFLHIRPPQRVAPLRLKRLSSTTCIHVPTHSKSCLQSQWPRT